MIPFAFGIYSIARTYFSLIRPLLRNQVMVESDVAKKKRYTQVVDESIGRMMNGGLAVLISVASLYTWLFVYFVTLEE